MYLLKSTQCTHEFCDDPCERIQAVMEQTTFAGCGHMNDEVSTLTLALADLALVDLVLGLLDSMPKGYHKAEDLAGI